ncbi:hypothetical protein [Methylobacterium radiodurans]|uniref:hypothetical protein n=1 Tax=Methylobacterium radiodurans TaxID=2202828 RepID=UPI0013A5A185|nr:hypothetical protein [Methylobacterium radiodurans]
MPTARESAYFDGPEKEKAPEKGAVFLTITSIVMVGATGIEPVTPTMSMIFPGWNARKSLDFSSEPFRQKGLMFRPRSRFLVRRTSGNYQDGAPVV